MLVFLARYCEAVKGGEQLKDRYGIWTGKRRYLVKLRTDSASPGRIIHPPGSFFIIQDSHCIAEGVGPKVISRQIVLVNDVDFASQRIM